MKVAVDTNILFSAFRDQSESDLVNNVAHDAPNIQFTFVFERNGRESTVFRAQLNFVL